ncbi:MAG TPA: hypothetical protein VLF66_06140, partial [Thermoanaerobaculia bacterium]|nr:hypothetical protein [Thermoanaerobaculia bacterium]
MGTGREWVRWGAVAAVAAVPGIAAVFGAGGAFHPSAARTADGAPVAPELLAGSSEACGRC